MTTRRPARRSRVQSKEGFDAAELWLCFVPGMRSNRRVAREVKRFYQKKRRRLIPVVFSRYLDSANLTGTDLSQLTGSERIWIDEPSQASPSDGVIGAIQSQFRFRRANTLRCYSLAAVTGLIAIALAIAIAQGNRAMQQAIAAEHGRQ